MCCQRLESNLGHLDSATGSRTCLEAEEEDEWEEEEVVLMADKDWNSRIAPLRCEDEESSELEKVHLESMSLVPLTKPVSTKQVHTSPGPGCSKYQLYQEDGGKRSLGQHPGIEDLPCEPAWLLHAHTLPPNSPVLLQGIADLEKTDQDQKY